MNIYLIRHGRQDSPLCNVDVPLSAEGRLQAKLLGERFLKTPPDLVYSSDLLRARETAEIANEIWRCPHLIRAGLREISFGDMEGLSDGEIAARFPDFLMEKDSMSRDIPYPGGECAGDVVKRAMPVLLEIAKTDAAQAAVVTHGGVIRSLLCHILGMDCAKNRLIARHLENCGITEIEYRRENGRFYVNRLNDYAHLEAYPELLRSGWSGK